MADNSDNTGKSNQARENVIAFPHSRVSPTLAGVKYRELGMGKMADTLGAAVEQQSGHWCSRCKGIWFGFLLEVECPKCGNRQG